MQTQAWNCDCAQSNSVGIQTLSLKCHWRRRPMMRARSIFLLAPYSLRRRPCVPITAEVAPRSSATVAIIFVVLVVFFGAAPVASGQLTTPVDGFIFQHHHAHVSGRPKETMPDRTSMMDVAVAQAAWLVLHDAGHAVFDIFNTPIFGHTKDAAQAEERRQQYRSALLTSSLIATPDDRYRASATRMELMPPADPPTPFQRRGIRARSP
jgi:hypothetical protein